MYLRNLMSMDTEEMIRALYDWTLRWAGSRHAPVAMGTVSFVESSVFPIPADVLFIPMVLAKPAGMNPRVLADALVTELAKLPEVTAAEIAGPGFINLRIAASAWVEELRAIAALGGDYGRSQVGAGTTVNVEYVSANPTGPMHMGHCRGAVVGDALADLLVFSGHKVIKEYYVNDAGAQVDVLARSVHLRYREALGETIESIPEGLYPGEYLKDVGAAIAKRDGARWIGKPEADWLPEMRAFAIATLMAEIKALGLSNALIGRSRVPVTRGLLGAAARHYRERFSDAFCHDYFLPMMACIWSCPTDQMLQFPVATMVRFCHNHGLLQISNRPQWWTVTGGARHYVDKIIAEVDDKRLNTPVRRIERDAAGVRVVTDGHTEHFDRLVLATHSDQALALLAAPTPNERAVLGAIRYQANRAVLHTDTSVLPTRRAAWAAWNYERAAQSGRESAQVCLHYLLNRLQPLPFTQPVLVSLNPVRDIDPAQVLGSYDYAHPVFDLAAIRAQARVPALQGHLATFYAGAWCGYGFHEDGLKSGLRAARSLIEYLGLVPVTDDQAARRAALPGVFA